MADNQVIEHRYPDGLPYGPAEYVKVEMTTKGPKWEVKAATPARFGEMLKELKEQCATNGLTFDQ